LSYAGKVRLGVASDARIVSDPSRITRAFEEEIEDLVLRTSPA
jgi:hypothetical protein